MARTFRGWPAEALEFFAGLEADNTRTWFQAHRGVYEQAVRAPLEALLEDVAAEFGEGRVFRPNRDRRFSADKSPYKTWAAAVIHRPAGGWYVHLSADGLLAGAGLHAPATDQLQRFRAAVADDGTGPELERLVQDLERNGYEVGGEAVATAPRGYGKDHPRIGLLRRKELIVTRHWPPRVWLHTAKAKTVIVQVWRDARPLLAWFEAHVGPSRDAPRRR